MAKKAIIAGRCAIRLVTEVACKFLLCNVSLQIIILSPHPRLGKFVFSDPKRVLQHYRGKSRKHLLALSFSACDPKRSSAIPSRLHFGRPEPWEGRQAALLVSRDVLTKAQMSACGG